MRQKLPVLLIACVLPACGGGRIVTPDVAPPGNALITPIYAVQGQTDASPSQGQTVTITGIVTGDFQDGDADGLNNLGGFFLQEEIPDRDSQTSNGIFVFDRDTLGPDVRVSDRVSVAGRVEERSGETQVIARQIDVFGRGTVSATELVLPLAATTMTNSGQIVADLEPYEGMLVTLPQALTVSDLYGLERYGEILLTQNGRLVQFTSNNQPDSANFATRQIGDALRSIVLDDGSVKQNKRPVRYLNPAAVGDSDGYAIRIGDRTSNLTGNIRYGRGSDNAGSESFRLVPVDEPQFESVNLRAPTPDVGGDIRVMSFNALNYFTTIDSGQNICGPAGSFGCRGADSIEEFDRQRAKTVHTILAAGPHLVGLMEIENNQDASLRSIVGGLNAAAGESHWSYVDTGAIGTDAIKVGFVFDASVVIPVGAFALLDSTVDPRFLDKKNRVTLAQTFSSVANGAQFTVAVNHLKSKGSDCNTIGDPDAGDGQGNCNGTRTNAAAALADWMATDPTGSGDADVLIIGDMNAYLREDPVETIVAAGFENVLESFAGPDVYSFVFRGRAGALDHAFASPSLVPQIVDVSEWHINADEPPMFDYNLDFGRDKLLFEANDPYRTSDHDPVMIGLSLSPD